MAFLVNAHLHWLSPGDVINSPRGEPMHEEPRVVLPGWQAVAFLLKGAPVGVLVIRPGNVELRYCDREGIIHREPVKGLDFDDIMEKGIARMVYLIGQFLGERHPLAAMPSANAVAA